MHEKNDLAQSQSKDPEAVFQEALKCEVQGDFASALHLIESLLEFLPEHVSLKEKRATYLLILEEFEKSVDDFRSLQHLDPLNPTYASNLAIGLARQQDFDGAINASKRAIVLKPDYGFAYNNLGGVLRDLGAIEHSKSVYTWGTLISPENALFQWGLSIACLMLGDFEKGWALYEAGFKCGERMPRNFSSAKLTPANDVQGKKLLIHSEQGYGDTIQMVRYLLEPKLAKTEVILEVEDSLIPLLSGMRAGLTLIKKGEVPPVHDFHCPMMSLPLAFESTNPSLPRQTPYIKVNDKKRGEWQSHIGASSKLRVGIAWSGNPTHKNDHNRSIPLALLQALFWRDAEFHAIQKEIRHDDSALVEAIPNLTVHSPNLRDFSDTAALIDAMDLIISVDTSVAHLAGALGKPTFLMVPYVPDFRWLLTREDSLWYPSFVLFRQPSIGDWSTVIDRVSVALHETLG